MASILQRRPSVEPVLGTELAEYLRLDNSDMMYLDSLIVSARTVIEARTGCRLIEQLWSQLVTGQPHGDIELQHWPVIAVQSVTILGDTPVTLNPERYQLVTSARPSFVRPSSGGWPNLRPSQHGLSIDLRAGFGGTPADIPEALRQAILLLAAYWYESDEWNNLSAAAAIPDMVHQLIDPFRLVRVM